MKERLLPSTIFTFLLTVCFLLLYVVYPYYYTFNKPLNLAVSKDGYTSPIDFDVLKQRNPDIYAWLEIPNTDVSYAVVQSKTDDTLYLNHNEVRQPSRQGAIFSESAYNKDDFSDNVTALYGHNMRTGAMFGSLHNIYNGDITNVKEIVVYLPNKELHYSFFAAVPYGNRHILYSYDFSKEAVFYDFIEYITSVRAFDSVIDNTAVPSFNNKVLILSTCRSGGGDDRYLVLASLQKTIE